MAQVPLLFEMGSPGRVGYRVPECDVPKKPLEELFGEDALRKEPLPLPELGELEVVRHFVQLSRLNHGVDVGFYPLGSCTMKYNPKINEDAANLPGFARLHPYQREDTVQGALQLMYELGEYLAEIAGLPRVTLHPAAGAHGELTGLLLIRAYHESRGEGDTRREIIVPDSAHGTNPATAAMCGFIPVEVKSDERGGVDLAALKEVLGPQTAGLMLTNPNTLGLYDENILAITRLVHEAGGLVYYDGANMNANMGISRPGDMGFDVVHFNVHKTFSTPHGGGGPGAGPIAVAECLAPFLPVPTVEKDEAGKFYLNYDLPQSIGMVKGFYGNFAVLVRGYTYIRMMGPEGLRRASEDAVLNANYLFARLKDYFDVPYPRICKHEFVLSAKSYKEKYGVRTLDMAKRLLDYGYHAPTVYFPLIVEEALMIEPTETETKETLDEFVEAMIEICEEAKRDPETVKTAPHTTPVGRLDETRAARQLDLRWRKSS
ncbi:MAG: aminomethyl-transferring glycine dehydrogenase subunit GcvPB [Firmicutes bacterium]|jgi:glycine dehydrogenase subunit 2|nr:aminomethyl-transferring glycine dehydrogenase subunit GcvPB [Bacillota bacterium]